MSDWLVAGDFVAHSGKVLPFKIECDALTDGEIAAFAGIIARLVPSPFSDVIGVPRGGLRLAEALKSHAVTLDDRVTLIVDDVFTTGASMKAARNQIVDTPVIGAVLFARSPCPSWIYPVFRMGR